MKKLVLLLIIPFLSFGQDLTYVPDDNFEQKLIDLGYDNMLDDYVLTENINSVSDLNVESQNIADLTGLGGFSSLQVLECQYNQLTTLDVSNNVNLLQLVCFNNQLINLDVSQNTDLLFLQCSWNQLTTLDVSQNTSLNNLTCLGNYFTNLNVSNNNFLTIIDARGNPLTSLDVSQNVSLNWLFFDNTQITSIDVSQNTALTFLYCPNNQLTSLDVSNNFNLISLACQNNLLSTLNLKNGNNQNMAINSNWGNDHVNLTDNPNLFCIDVDNEYWSTTNWTVANGNIDSWANFSANCATTANCVDDDESMSIAFSSEVFYPYSLPGAGCENGFTFLNGFGYSCDSTIGGFDGYNTIGDMCACTCSDGVVGCMNMSTCNYNANATIDNGSCLFPGDECVLLIDLNNDVLEYGILNENCVCLGSSIIDEMLISKNLIKTIDVLGRESTNKGLQLHIYDDGTVEKKYLIK
tara:strand:- start:1 stop:1398 length:1398 start_codon:yes stop_codon:yes gene_type:complete